MEHKLNKYEVENIEELTGLPVEKATERLRNILEEHGVSKENCEDWLNWSDFYYALLGYGGELSKRGADLLLYFKDYIGDRKKESYIEMFVID